MRYRTLAPDLTVSEVGFGNWTVTTGWWGNYSDDEAVALHRDAFDHGITFFDTAQTYGDGYAEDVLGRALGDVRDEVVIATKFGYELSGEARSGQSERAHDIRPDTVRAGLTDSLRRLRTEYLDCFQLHNPRMTHIESDELFALLEEEKAAGRIRSYGVALGPRIGWRDEGVAAMRRHHPDVVQLIHNILEQDPGRDLLKVAAETGARGVVRVPHSSGMLEGNLSEHTVFPESDHRRHRTKAWLVEGARKVAALEFLTDGRTMGQAALRWLLADGAVASTLPNIYGREQLSEFAAASDVADLSNDEFRRVAELYARNFDVEPIADQTTRLWQVAAPPAAAGTE